MAATARTAAIMSTETPTRTAEGTAIGTVRTTIHPNGRAVCLMREDNIKRNEHCEYGQKYFLYERIPKICP